MRKPLNINVDWFSIIYQHTSIVRRVWLLFGLLAFLYALWNPMKPNKFPSIHRRRRRRPSCAQLAATTTSHHQPPQHTAEKNERIERQFFHIFLPSIEQCRFLHFLIYSLVFLLIIFLLLRVCVICYMSTKRWRSCYPIKPCLTDFSSILSRTHIPPYSLLFREHTLRRWRLFLRREGDW